MSGSGRVYLEPGSDKFDDLVQSGEKIGVDVAAHVSLPGAKDAFGRIRTSEPHIVFESKQVYPEPDGVWLNDTTISGQVTHKPNESLSELSVGTTAGAKVIRQTGDYFQYQPGKSQQILITGVMGAIKSGVRQRIGYFDDDNGLFFEQDGVDLKVVQRSKSSGSVVDTAVTAASWRIDALDGSGRSTITLDNTKAQIFSISYQWLGVGRTEFGFNIDGKPVSAHSFFNANTLDTTFMSTPDLPVRFELENLTATSSTTTMKQICVSIISEGGFERQGYPFSISNGTTGVAITTTGWTPVLGIKVNSTFQGKTNRMQINMREVDLFASGGNAHWRIKYKTDDTGGSWLAVDTATSGMLYKADANSLAGGIITNSGYLAASANRTGLFRETEVGTNKFPMGVDIAGTNASTLFLEAKSIDNNVTFYSSFDWGEIY